MTDYLHLERQVLVSIMQNQHSSYSMSSSRNTDESCHLGVWLFHDSAPAHKSLVAQQALCNCEFVQLNHPAYSPDLAPSDYFLIRNLKYHFRGSWFTNDESLTIADEAWFESQNRKLYFQGKNCWEKKLKNALMLQQNMSKNDSICDIICEFFYSQIAILFIAFVIFLKRCS